jgi:phosphatidylglycerophosphate synthase
MVSNAVTSLRIVLLPLLFWLLLQAGATDRLCALAALGLAGLTDVVDGKIARARGEVSQLGGLLDLIADRLLTLTVLAGLMASGEVTGPFVVAAMVLIGRDLIVASFSEAAPQLAIKVSPLEKAKIALQFGGFGLLVAPPVVAYVPQYEVGRWALVAAAAIACVTVAGYARRAGEALSHPSPSWGGTDDAQHRQGGNVRVL